MFFSVIPVFCWCVDRYLRFEERTHKSVITDRPTFRPWLPSPLLPPRSCQLDLFRRNATPLSPSSCAL